MTKLDSSLKLKLIFLLVISNFSVYLICSSPESDESLNYQITELERDGYSELKLSGELLTSFTPEKAITILSLDKKVLVPFALLRRQFGKQSSEFGLEETNPSDSYLVYLPETEVQKVLGKSNLLFVPYGKNYQVKKPQGRSYEVHL